MNKLITGAKFSECRKYRYRLWRIWDSKKPRVAFVCLNPSTADEIENDNTVTRCINYSKAWGFGGYHMLNIFGYRSTDPKGMKRQDDPVGRDNDRTLQLAHATVHAIVCAWGNDGLHEGRGEQVKELLSGPLYCLKTTKKGQPWHPLYLSSSLKPIMFKPPERNRELFDQMMTRVHSGDTLFADEVVANNRYFMPQE